MLRRLTALNDSYRGWLLGIGVLAAACTLVLPVLVTGPDHIPPGLLLAAACGCALLVGIGRQGIDAFVLRLLATGILVAIGWVAGGALLQGNSICPDLSQCDAITIDLVFLGLAIATVLAIGSIPMWIVWNRRRGLRLDLPWRVLVPRAWWHWAAAVAVFGVLFASCVIAFPAPP
jgi:hypothetical protein